MSTQRFTSDQRFAFWRAYDGKCIYCRSPILEISNLRIDHVIPEDLAKLEKKEQLEKLLFKLNLPNNYDIFAYYNLVSSCSRCNALKSSKTGLIPNSILLNEASEKSVVVTKLVDKYRKKIVANNDTNPSTIPFKFMFRDRNIRGPIGKSKLVDLYDLPVYAGGVEEFYLEGFGSTRPKNPPRINTVNDYVAAINNGWYADTMFSMKMSGWFEKARCFLNALEKAILPKISYFSDNMFNLTKLDDISETIARQIWSEDEGLVSDFDSYTWKTDRSINEYFLHLAVNSKKPKLISYTEDVLIFEADYTRFYLEELLRCDFSGHGYEEILCVYGLDVVGGSLGFSNVVLLQKESPDAFVTFQDYRCT